MYYSTCVHSEMVKRKTRYFPKKYKHYYTKELVVSLPLELFQVQGSLLKQYLEAPIASGRELQARVAHSKMLPLGWTQALSIKTDNCTSEPAETTCTPNMVLCQVCCSILKHTKHEVVHPTTGILGLGVFSIVTHRKCIAKHMINPRISAVWSTTKPIACTRSTYQS